MHNGLDARMARLFNRQGDGRAVCVAADHGYLSDVTPNVVKLKSITEAVIRGGVDGILMSPGQAMRLAPLFQGHAGPALIVRADWMNMPRLGSMNVANSVPQRKLAHQKILTAEQALSLGATAITIYLFLGYGDDVEARCVDSCARFAAECRKVGLPCIMEPIAAGGQITGANVVEVLTLGARICVEIGADANHRGAPVIPALCDSPLPGARRIFGSHRNHASGVTFNTIQFDADEPGPGLLRQDPRPPLPRRIVTDVLTMAAFEVCNPVLLLVLMESDNTPLHDSILAQGEPGERHRAAAIMYSRQQASTRSSFA